MIYAKDELADKRAGSYTPEVDVLRVYWATVLHRPLDEFPLSRYMSVWKEIKETLIESDAYVCLNAVEELLKVIDDVDVWWQAELAEKTRSLVNSTFEKFMVGYRFIQGEIAPVGTTTEANAISEAIAAPGVTAGARRALEKATAHLADRDNPDYANSVKESISAVESIVRTITGKDSLGAGLKVLEQKGVEIHPALAKGWDKLYGWASDASGIRHANIDADEVDQTLAKYMLVSCSAFVSYLIEEATKQGIDWEQGQLPKI